MLASVAQHASTSWYFEGGGEIREVQPHLHREFKASVDYETLPQKEQNPKGLSVSTVDSKCRVAGPLLSPSSCFSLPVFRAFQLLPLRRF